MARVRIPKGILIDAGVPGNTRLGGGINAPSGSRSGILQDVGVPGQVMGDYTRPPLTYGGHTLDQTQPDSGTVWGPGGPGTPPAAPTPNPYRGYFGTIFDDLGYQAGLKQYLGKMGMAATNRAAAMRNAVQRFGYTPTDWGNLGSDLAGYAGDLDQATLDAAGQNPMSMKAQIQSGYERNLRMMRDQLAARGEGLLGYGAEQSNNANLQQQFNTQNSQAMNQLLDALRGNVGDYLTASQTAEGGLNDAYSAVAARLAGQPGPTYPVGTTNPVGGIAANVENAAAGEGGAVRWGGRNFSTRAELSAFLNSLPISITPAQFAASHPDEWARLS